MPLLGDACVVNWRLDLAKNSQNGVARPERRRAALRVGLRVSARTSGGGLVFATELAHALATAEGCAGVTLFVLGDVGSLDVPRTARVVPVATASSTLKRRTRGSRAMVAALRAHPVDVLVCPGTELSKIEGVPTVLWPLTVAPFEPETVRLLGHTPWRRLRWHALRAAIRASCRRADAFVFSSHYARALHVQSLPSMAQRPSTVIHPGPSLHPEVSADPPGGTDLPMPFLLFVSHLYPYKMLVELIVGFARCVQDPQFTEHLVVAGRAVDPAYEGRVRKIIGQHELHSRVHLLGAVEKPQLDVLYRAAEAFVFPSLSENAGSYALIDAFAYGKPVISSLTSSMPEICQGAASFMEPREPEHIAQQIAAVAASSTLRRELAARSERHAESFPSWDEIASRLLTFVGSVVDGAHATSSHQARRRGVWYR